ncbi:MAG: copper resistance protein CopC, partial [Gammaproteobacteria bacterium]
LSEPAPGTYVVSWRAASADGDVMPGRIRFTVSGGAASQGERR